MLLSKSDIPLYSIASREKYMVHMMVAKTGVMTGSMHESMTESIDDTNRYSAFTHGNGLNDFYANQGASHLKKNGNFCVCFINLKDHLKLMVYMSICFCKQSVYF